MREVRDDSKCNQNKKRVVKEGERSGEVVDGGGGNVGRGEKEASKAEVGQRGLFYDYALQR